MKYRIREEIGTKTGAKQYFIEKCRFKKWRQLYEYHPLNDRRMVKFSELPDAQYKLKELTELVYITYLFK